MHIELNKLPDYIILSHKGKNKPCFGYIQNKTLVPTYQTEYLVISKLFQFNFHNILSITVLSNSCCNI